MTGQIDVCAVFPTQGQRPCPKTPAAPAFAMLDLAITSAVALLVTIDPIGTGPVFAALTRGSDDAHKRRMAVKGVVIAAVILFVFAFVGEFLLRALGIGFPAFRIAGGILL